MQKRDYFDANGIQRRVLLPDDGAAADPSEGIPLSLDIGALYPHMPPEFVTALTNELWALGFVEPSDFLMKGALPRIQAAVLAVVRRDALDLIAFAQEQQIRNP